MSRRALGYGLLFSAVLWSWAVLGYFTLDAVIR